MHTRNRAKNAELLSLLGAVLAGVGAALYFHQQLIPHRFVLLVVGIALHAAAMVYRRRLERGQGDAPTAWESALYWSCGLLILALMAYLALGGTA